MAIATLAIATVSLGGTISLCIWWVDEEDCEDPIDDNEWSRRYLQKKKWKFYIFSDTTCMS